MNRSKTTALLPLNALAMLVQKLGAYCASGIGFWQVALASVQAPTSELPGYAP